MARRRKRKIKNPLEYIAIPEFGVSSEAKRGIFILIILAIGAFSLLGLFDLAGGVGKYLAKGQELAFGWGRWVFPFVLFIWGFFLYKEDRAYFRGAGFLGLFLGLVSIESLFHFFLPQEVWKTAIADGRGGGFVGFFMANIFLKLLGFWGSLVALFILLLIALVLIFDVSLVKLIGGESIFAKMFSPIRALFARLFNGEEREEIEEEEYEEEEEEEIEEEDDEEEESDYAEASSDEGGNEKVFAKKEVMDEPEFMEEQESEEEIEGTEDKKGSWKSSKVKIELPLKLLTSNSSKPTSGDIKGNSLIIQTTLENFGINVDMGDVSVGPTVTQYTFRPREGVKLSRITTLGNDLALALAAHPIRIEAPIPGRALVGIEVPNKTKALVGLKEIMDGKDFKNRKNNLTTAIGKDVSGKPWSYDITKMPHLLVAGATNSGKSVCLNSVIISLLYQNNPEDLRFIMVDPKRVELTVYNGIPHLLTPVITNVNKTINALKWCLNEMDRRFEILSLNKKRNIQTYNESAKEKMPYIVFIVDELADLMVAASRDIEASIIRLAQMARAVGIHLVLATQRPSVDVITGLIKANMPARIAFSVASGVDSKTILDSLGAEKLLGKGDMLFLTAELSKPKRLQGAFVDDKEIKNIVEYIKQRGGEFDYVDGITDRQKVGGIAGVGLDGRTGDEDELFGEAKEIIINMNKASASFLQRKLSIGYARAARLLDELEEAGVVGQSNGAKPREILVSKEEYENQIGTPTSGATLHNRDEAEAPESYLGDDEEDENSLGEESEDETVFEDDNEEINEDEKSDKEAKEEDNEEIEDDEDDEVDESEEEKIDEKEEQDKKEDASADSVDSLQSDSGQAPQASSPQSDSGQAAQGKEKDKTEKKETKKDSRAEEDDEMFFSR